jgi:hypothetical protein
LPIMLYACCSCDWRVICMHSAKLIVNTGRHSAINIWIWNSISGCMYWSYDMAGQQNVSFIGACHEATTMHVIHVTTVIWLTYEPNIDTANSTKKHGELLCYVIVLCFRVYVNLCMVMLIEHLSSLNFRMMK